MRRVYGAATPGLHWPWKSWAWYAARIAAPCTATPARCSTATKRASAIMSIKKILVVAPSWVGDTMLIQPMLRRLRERYPDCELDILAPPWTEALLRVMPEVHDVIINPFPHGALQLGARRRLGKELREKRYDKAIVLPNSLKSALVPFFANIPLRI